MTKTKKNSNNMISKFFNSYVPILALSLVTSIIAIIYALVLGASYKVYSFYAFNETTSINSGIITLTNKSTVFEGNNIKYREELDKKVTEYTVGYYLKDGDNYITLLSATDKPEKEVSLKDVIKSIVGFDFVEPARSKGVRLEFNKRNLIKDNLYFIAKYKESGSDEITTETLKLLVTEVN